jgi:uncharacterized protein (TIGR03437 family)
MRSRWIQFSSFAAAFTAFAGLSSGYFHYLHYTAHSSPYDSIPEKFDIAALPNKTVSYFVSQRQDGVQLAPGDTFRGLVSQIRAAAKVWNDVETSELRLSYGGLNDGDPGNATPSIEVMLGEVPPGLVATTARTVSDANASFVPVSKAIIVVRQDLHDRPSYGEAFFGTIVHEFGHAVGLQHTFTGSVMSTGITRATSRSKPVTADDIAGVSLLYPTKSFAARTGSISGRVTAGGQGVHLASVVAIAINGPALSGMTAPDGRYRIDGVPSGDYLIYVSPLPPAQQGQGETTPGNINFPLDDSGHSVGPSGSFDTTFYPGTRNPQQAAHTAVRAGANVPDMNFSVRSRTAPAIHSVSTFSYPGPFSVKPAYLNSTMQYPMIVADGAGLTDASGVVGGFNVSVIGGDQLSVRAFPGYARWAIFDIDPASLTASEDGPRHLLFTTQNDIYILPAGYWQAHDAPPSINSVSPVDDGARTVSVTGTNLHGNTQVLFDGVAVGSRGIDDGGRLLVTAPQAAPGTQANVVVVNSDGQSSAFVQDPAPVFTFDIQNTGAAAASMSATITPATLPADATAVIEISSTAANFVEGQVWVGFGTSDITVRRMWIINGSTVRANVTVAPGATVGLLQPIVMSGLQSISVNPFEITAKNPRVVSLNPILVNIATGQTYVYTGETVAVSIAGAAVSISSLNLSQSSSLTLDGKPVQILSINGNQLIFQIPAGQAPGLAVLRLDAGSDRGNPVLVTIDAPPPQITGISNGDNEALDANRSVHPGDTIVLHVTGLGAAGATIATGRVTVNIAANDVRPASISATDAGFDVTVTVPKDFNPPAHAVPVTIAIDGHTSRAVDLNISK